MCAAAALATFLSGGWRSGAARAARPRALVCNAPRQSIAPAACDNDRAPCACDRVSMFVLLCGCAVPSLQVFRYCERVSQLLAQGEREGKRVVHVSCADPHKVANAVFLACSYTIVCMGKSAEEAWAPFSGTCRAGGSVVSCDLPAYQRVVRVRATVARDAA